MFKFNSNHILTGYIKQLLHSFNLPKVRVFVENEPPIKTLVYHKIGDSGLTTKDDVNKANEVLMYVPYIRNGRIEEYRETSANNWEWVPKGWSSKKLSTHTHFYEYNERMPNYTKNLEIKNNIYDSYTHEYLGDYLRFQRDYNHINLMPLYNCFSNRICSNLSLNIIKNNISISTFSGSDTKYKIYMLPIKLFKEYTIAIDSDLAIEICCGIYGKYQGTNQALKDLPATTYVKLNSTNFNRPFLYDNLATIDLLTKNVEDRDTFLNNLAQNELNLKMFIKVPVGVNSSITILEGNYIGWNDTINVSKNKYKSYPNYAINNIEKPYLNENANYKYITSLQLLELNTTESYPFADRLIEYLIGNAITPLDKLPDNIERAQKVLEINNLLTSPYKGIWSNTMMPIIYSYMNTANINNTTSNNYDILGYIDKDVETLFKNKQIGNANNNWHTIASEDLYTNIYKSDKGDS